MEHDDRGCRIPSLEPANGGATHQGWTSAGPQGRAPDPYRTRGGAHLRTGLPGWIGETLATAPADPAWLRRRMAGWTGARFGVSEASFSVVLSQLRRALRHAGPPRKADTATALGPQWQRLADAVRDYWTRYRKAQGAAPGQNWLSIRLARFFRWCDAAGIAPDAVDDAVIAAYIDAVAATALRGDISEKERGLRKAWNHAQAHVAGWPAMAVATRRAPRAKPVVSLLEDRFSPSFVAELDAYREHLGFLTAP